MLIIGYFVVDITTIKNTANYETTFAGNEIVQRFVRVDESRTCEWAGLGLSIAQSFTQICGGTFAVNIDGDLFKVDLRFRWLPISAGLSAGSISLVLLRLTEYVVFKISTLQLYDYGKIT